MAEILAKQLAKTTIDLQQAAGKYDLFTAINQDILVDKLVIRMPNVNLLDGDAITGISIQTDDIAPAEFLDAGLGNLQAGAQLAYSGAILVKVEGKIQLTIDTGPADEPTVCDVVVEYRPLAIDGGHLA